MAGVRVIWTGISGEGGRKKLNGGEGELHGHKGDDEASLRRVVKSFNLG